MRKLTTINGNVAFTNYRNGCRRSFNTYNVVWSAVPAVTGFDRRTKAFRDAEAAGLAGGECLKCSSAEAQGLRWQAELRVKLAQQRLAVRFTGIDLDV